MRFRIRVFLLLIVILATLLGPGYRAYRRYTATRLTRTYYVGDLISGDPELTGFAALAKASVPRDVWARDRAVTPFFPSRSLMVRDSEEGHQNVAAWLRQRRDRRNGRTP